MCLAWFLIYHMPNKIIRWPVFNATLTSVSSVSASRVCNAFPSEEIAAVLNVYWLIVSTCTLPWSGGGEGGGIL